MADQRCTAYIVPLADGSFRADFEGFGGFHVHAATIDELKQIALGQLAGHIDDLQRMHEPVFMVSSIEWSETTPTG